MDHGDEREMESGLIFNQLICEFESRRPCQFLPTGCGLPFSEKILTNYLKTLLCDDYFRGKRQLMNVAIELPKEIAESLAGPDEALSRIALEALAAQGYGNGKLSHSEVQHLLRFNSR